MTRYVIFDTADMSIIDGDTYDTRADLFRNMSYCSSRWYNPTLRILVIDFTGKEPTRDITADAVSAWLASDEGHDAVLDATNDGADLPVFADRRYRTPAPEHLFTDPATERAMEDL